MSKFYKVVECELPVNPALNTPKVGDIVKWKLIGSDKMMMVRLCDNEIVFGMQLHEGRPFGANSAVFIEGKFGDRNLKIKLEEVHNECVVINKTAQS